MRILHYLRRALLGDRRTPRKAESCHKCGRPLGANVIRDRDGYGYDLLECYLERMFTKARAGV